MPIRVTPATPTAGTPITVADRVTNINNNLNNVFGLLPEPADVGYPLVSTATGLGTSSASFKKLTAAGIDATGLDAATLGGNTAAAFVAAVGDTMTGQLAVALDVGVSGTSYANGHLQLVSSGASNYPQVGFHRAGLEGGAIYYSGGAFKFIRHDATIETFATRIPGRIVGWNASSASVPSGYIVHTALIDRVPIGAGNLFAFGAVGGSYTHSHSTDLTHAHGMSQHNHDVTHDHGNTDGPTSGMSVNGSGASTAANMSHLHHVNNYNGNTGTGGPTSTNNGSGVVTLGPTDHTPPFCSITIIVET